MKDHVTGDEITLYSVFMDLRGECFRTIVRAE